jgi:hypothetical protein
MTRHLLVYIDGAPVMIAARDDTGLPRSFTISRRQFFKWRFKDTAFVTFCHETCHTLQYRDAKGAGWMHVATFLFSYLGKKLLRLCHVNVRDMYEDEANREEGIIAAGNHERIQIPTETRAVFG